MCTPAWLGGGIHTHTHMPAHKHTHTRRWGADFVVLSQKGGAVRLNMELSMNTNSKMRTRCRIPYACWVKKIEARREKREGEDGAPKKKEGSEKRTERERG